MNKAQVFNDDSLHDSFNGLDRKGEDLVLTLNKIPYHLTLDDAMTLQERLSELLIETIIYDGRN